MKHRALLALLALALLGAGCALATGPDRGPDAALLAGDEIVFRAERGEYRQGETARVVLGNESGERVGYNLCSSWRELRVGGEWRKIVPLRMCTGHLDVLEPGAEAVLEEPITAEWEPGEYRMATRVHALEGEGGAEVRTPPFRVVR